MYITHTIIIFSPKFNYFFNKRYNNNRTYHYGNV